jgi:PAS domain S-box-containing protein
LQPQISTQPLHDEHKFQLLVESVTDYAIYMLDRHGHVTSWNSGAKLLKGYSVAEALGMHLSRFFTPEDRAAGAPQRILATAEHEGRAESEGWRVRKDGSRFWALAVVHAIRADGDLIGFAKVTRDMTERKVAQEALRDSERRFRVLVDGVVDYAIYMVDPDGIITNWNTGAERLKGYAADEIIGRHFSRFYTEEDRASGLPARALGNAATAGRFESEGWRVRRDGSRFWASVVIDAIHDDAGRLVGFAKVTRDITERRDAQLALQRTQAQQAYAQRVEALAQLTGGVAHDFNNLLMIIAGHVRTVKTMVGDDPRGRRAAEAIEIAARRAESLTRQLLSYSRRQTLQPIVVDVAARVDAVRQMLAGSLGAGVTLVDHIQSGLWTIRVDVSEFELALVNLALNARDAMPDGGPITVAAENVVLSADDTPAGLSGDFVVITVSDTGAGIPLDVLPKVFDPFFTTKGADKGTGLGLSQVHGFAHQSGGTVTIASELRRGTRVALYLPRADATATANPPAAVENVGGTGAVLVVEDNPDVADVTRAMLEDLGYAVDVSTDAATALTQIQSRDYAALISDIVMAGDMDGLALARAVRAARPTLPILLVTGYSNALGDSQGEFAVLRKPYHLDELGRALAVVAARAGPPADRPNPARGPG